MTDTIDHVLLTRFNLPSAGVERSIRDQEGWLTHRVALFERYCLPSVMAQSIRNFSWIVYFDPASPDWLKARVAQYSATGILTPVYRASVSREQLVGDIHEATGGRGELLATTNLDNDDAIAVDFVERIQAIPRPANRTAVFLVRGLIQGQAGTYLRVDRDNAFCTVIEPSGAPTTCWADWHMLLRRSMPVVELAGAPGWLQVVHGENVSNRVRGRLVSPVPWRRLFPGALDDAVAPRAGALVRDRLVSAPMRALRETARGGAKTLALAVLGKDGLDRLKLALAGGGR